MIGAFVAGAIGGALFASPEHVVNETHVHMPEQKNQLIEYHEWLEKRRKEQMTSDDNEIRRIYRYRNEHCPDCNEKIEMSVDKMRMLESTLYELKVKCKCKECKTHISISVYDQDADQKLNDELRKLKFKTYGSVEYATVRKEFLDKKLADKTEEELYYGKQICML